MSFFIFKESKKVTVAKKETLERIKELEKTKELYDKVSDLIYIGTKKYTKEGVWFSQKDAALIMSTGIDLVKYREFIDKKGDHYGYSDEIFRKVVYNQLEDDIADLRLEVLPTNKKYFNEYLFSDAHAYACVEEITPNKVVVVRLKAKVTEESKKALHDSFIPGGFCGHFDNDLQEWEYEMPTREEATLITLRRHKNGYWYPAGGSCKFGLSDQPYEYYDYNF